MQRVLATVLLLPALAAVGCGRPEAFSDREPKFVQVAIRPKIIAEMGQPGQYVAIRLSSHDSQWAYDQILIPKFKTDYPDTTVCSVTMPNPGRMLPGFSLEIIPPRGQRITLGELKPSGGSAILVTYPAYASAAMPWKGFNRSAAEVTARW